MVIGIRNIPQPSPGRLDVPGIIEAFAHRMMYSVAKDQYTARDFDVYQGLAYAVRDRLMERWFRTQNTYYHRDAKRVYYLSLEFLHGAGPAQQRPQPGRRGRLHARPWRSSASGLEDIARAGVGRRPGQRRPGPPRGLHPGLGGHPGAALLRLRHPLRVRHLPAEDPGRLPGRVPRQLAALRQPLGDPALRRHLPGALLRPHRARHGRARAGTASTGWTPRTSGPWPTTPRSPASATTP